jgi:hypothetical protein
MRFGIYAHDSVNNKPTTLIVEASYSLIVGKSAQWYTQDIPPTYLVAGTYWLAVMAAPDKIGTAFYYGPQISTSTSGGTNYYESLTSWGDLPTSFSGNSNSGIVAIKGYACHN